MRTFTTAKNPLASYDCRKLLLVETGLGFTSSFIQKHSGDFGGVLSVANTLITVAQWWMVLSWNNLSLTHFYYLGGMEEREFCSVSHCQYFGKEKDVMNPFTARKQDIFSQFFRLELKNWEKKGRAICLLLLPLNTLFHIT